jgi:3-methyladenine DNA glycosylase/8-oxoguanine DNA glycosylase
MSVGARTMPVTDDIVGPSVAHTLAALVPIGGDPTTAGSPSSFWRATITPDGPGTINIRWRRDVAGSVHITHECFGPGAQWLDQRLDDLIGKNDDGATWAPAPADRADRPGCVVNETFRRHGPILIGRTSTPYHDLLPTVIGQRITASEAARQWRRLCTVFGDAAPGPCSGLRLPPAAETLRSVPLWRFHPLGIESSRARTIIEVARRYEALSRLTTRPDDVSSRRAVDLLRSIPGVGVWTTSIVLTSAFGHPDSPTIGDYWIPHLVVRALTGASRGSDEEMLELLAPFAPQRGRVVQALMRAGHRVERRGPGRRTPPIERW